FQPSDDEFRVLYQHAKTMELLDEKLLQGMSSEAVVNARKQADDELRGALGENRYGDFGRSQDPLFIRITQLLNRFDLPIEISASVYDIKKAVAEETTRLSTDSNIQAGERESLLKAYRTDAERQIETILGKEAYQFYLRVGGPILNPKP